MPETSGNDEAAQTKQGRMNWREVQKIPKNVKIAVTDYSLDVWYSQNFGLDIDNMPPYRPPYVKDKRVYDYLKKKYKTPQV